MKRPAIEIHHARSVDPEVLRQLAAGIEEEGAPHEMAVHDGETDAGTLAARGARSSMLLVAIGIAERLGGQPTLTAALVLCTGIFGAIVVTPFLNLLGIRDWRARGLAVGTAAHGIGTARAFQVNPTAGAFAGIGMGLNAILTAIIAPLVVRLFQ